MNIFREDINKLSNSDLFQLRNMCLLEIERRESIDKAGKKKGKGKYKCKHLKYWATPYGATCKDCGEECG